MQVSSTPIVGLYLVDRPMHDDSRGFLSRLFCSEALLEAGWRKPVAQINHSFTAIAGTLRGLHFQRSPHAEMKLVSCFHGEVWDVAVDLRQGSPTFLRWHAELLSADNRRALIIPEGCAHGFQTLQDGTELLYCHSAAYCPSAEAGVRYDDPALGIQWPLPVQNLSSRDAVHPLIPADFTGFAFPPSQDAAST